MITLNLGEGSQKVFLKLQSQYAKAKRKPKKKSRSCASSVEKLKERLESLRFLAWLDNYGKPKSARSNNGDTSGEDNLEITDAKNNLNSTQPDGE